VADNKRIAAIAAALAVVEEETRAAASAAAPQPGGVQPIAAAGGSAPSLWALYGRQRIMDMRASMQRRVSARRV
jgi:hypothetical protein